MMTRIILLYLISTAIVVGVGYFGLGMHPSYDKQCWGWTSE